MQMENVTPVQMGLATPAQTEQVAPAQTEQAEIGEGRAENSTEDR